VRYGGSKSLYHCQTLKIEKYENLWIAENINRRKIIIATKIGLVKFFCQKIAINCTSVCHIFCQASGNQGYWVKGQISDSDIQLPTLPFPKFSDSVVTNATTTPPKILWLRTIPTLLATLTWMRVVQKQHDWCFHRLYRYMWHALKCIVCCNALFWCNSLKILIIFILKCHQ